jgi:hypothetical protein
VSLSLVFLPSFTPLIFDRFRSFLSALELNPANKSLNLESHLSSPWQRVMKYPLLLNEMINAASRSTSTTPIQKHFIELTLKKVQEVVGKINLVKHNDEQAGDLLDRESHYGLCLSGPSRRFLLEGKWKLITHNTKLSQNALLCSDVLFLGKRKRMFFPSTFVEYDLMNIKIIRSPPGVSRYFIIKLTENHGDDLPLSLSLSPSLLSPPLTPLFSQCSKSN